MKGEGLVSSTPKSDVKHFVPEFQACMKFYFILKTDYTVNVSSTFYICARLKSLSLKVVKHEVIVFILSSRYCNPNFS